MAEAVALIDTANGMDQHTEGLERIGYSIDERNIRRLT